MKIKKNHNQKKVDKIKVLLVSSAHSIFICIMLLVSVSWAWFRETVNIPDIKVRTAEYAIEAIVESDGEATNEGRSSVTAGSNLVFEVERGKVHNVTLTARGSAERYGGYCVVSAGDDLHYTVPIGGDENPEKISFQILFSGSGTGRIEFLPYWGAYPLTLTLPEEWKEADIPKEGDILVNGGGYEISGGDIRQVTPGDNHLSE